MHTSTPPWPFQFDFFIHFRPSFKHHITKILLPFRCCCQKDADCSLDPKPQNLGNGQMIPSSLITWIIKLGGMSKLNLRYYNFEICGWKILKWNIFPFLENSARRKYSQVEASKAYISTCFLNWEKSILSWPTKLKLLWECNWIPIQFVVPLFTKIKCLTRKYCREKKIINFFLSQMSTSRLILYFLYLDKNPVRFVSALKKLICNVCIGALFCS